MTTRRDTFGLKLSLEDAEEAVLETASLEGWKIKGRGKSYLLLQAIDHPMFLSPVKMKVTMKGDTPEITRVTLRGTRFGIGPIVSGPINRKMADFRRRLELASVERQGNETTNT